MHAASRDALEQSRSSLQSTLSTDNGGAQGAKVGSELFQVVDILEANRPLRVSVADQAASVEARQDLTRSVFGWKIDDATLSVLLAAVAQSWSTPRDLREGLVSLGREALLRSAEAQGQLQTVEDELFRLGRIVVGEPELERHLGDRTTTPEAKRALLGQLLYGKVTAVTEALASQAVARPDGMPADDIDAISTQAAELRGATVAVVTSASNLSAEQEAVLQEKLTSIYGRDMTVHSEVDADLLGGVVIRVGHEIIDGSVSGRISAARKAMP